MEKDFGLRFTDETYATKDDVKRALNISSIDSIWDKITQFRSYYTKQIELRNVERIPFSIVLPPKLTSKIVNLEKKLSKYLVKLSLGQIQNPQSIIKLKQDLYFSILKELSSNYEININDDTLVGLINETLPTLPVEYLFLNRYYHCLKYIESRHNGNFSPSVILSLYCKLRGMEFDVNELSKYYRTTDLLDKNDHIFVGKHYDAAPLEKIEEMVSSLCDFLNNSSIFSLCKAAVCYFYINYVKPFEYYNEEMALLLFKFVLAKEDFEQVPAIINIEDLLSKTYFDQINFLSKESEMKLDLTYITNFIVDHLQEQFVQITSLQEFNDYSLVKEEMYQIDEKAKKPLNNSAINFQEVIVEPSKLEIEGVNFKQSVSLPTMPTGLDEKDATLVAKNLLEIYPSMKKGQADFYSRHCTIGKYYTISQYKKEQNVAYETARTSMDNLVNLGFYKKEQIKNKFVYTPVINK